jgi:hypothetical protein
MKGGIRWKEGADTCIFKPSVACKEDPVKYPSDIPNKISRVVPNDAPDLKNESIIKDTFPELAKRGIISVYETKCTPKFIATNLTSSPSIRVYGPCKSIINESSYVNMITPEYTDTFGNYIEIKHGGILIGFQRAIELLRGAICAAIELVPDNGIWVIHGDLHLDNVLIKQELDSKTPASATYTALADWGRTILFKSSKFNSIHAGLEQYLHLLSDLFGPFYTYGDLANNPGVKGGRYKQFSLRVLYQLNLFMQKYTSGGLTEAILKDTLKVLRGYMVYVLLKQVYLQYRKPFPAWLQSVLETNSQKELADLINANLPKIRDEDYYTKRFVLNEALPPPADKPLFINLGGRRKIRKTRRQKRRSTRKRI